MTEFTVVDSNGLPSIHHPDFGIYKSLLHSELLYFLVFRLDWQMDLETIDMRSVVWKRECDPLGDQGYNPQRALEGARSRRDHLINEFFDQTSDYGAAVVGGGFCHIPEIFKDIWVKNDKLVTGLSDREIREFEFSLETLPGDLSELIECRLEHFGWDECFDLYYSEVIEQLIRVRLTECDIIERKRRGESFSDEQLAHAVLMGNQRKPVNTQGETL